MTYYPDFADGKIPTAAEIEERSAAIAARQQAEVEERVVHPKPTRTYHRPHKRPIGRVRRRRPAKPETRALLSEINRKRIAAIALADPNTSALRRARIEREQTIAQAAATCNVSPNTFKAAETNPTLLHPMTRRRIAAHYPEVAS